MADGLQNVEYVTKKMIENNICFNMFEMKSACN